jgi:hypothetical protein
LAGGTDAVQTLTTTAAGEPTGGTYTLTFDGDETGLIQWDATIAEVELALEAIDSIPNGSVAVTAEITDYTDGDLIFTFSGDLEGVQDDMVLDATNLTGGTGYAISTTTPGILGGSTTEIVLTAGLGTATASTGSVTFLGRKIDVTVGEGNIEYTEKKTRMFRLNRGSLNTVKNDDEEPMDVTFAFEWDYITASGTGGVVPTVEDVLKRTGPASEWTSAADDICDPYCVIIELNNVPVCTGSGNYQNEDIVLDKFYYEELSHSLEDSQISCTGRCNSIEAEATRY